jgi:hypothetical protein
MKMMDIPVGKGGGKASIEEDSPWEEKYVIALFSRITKIVKSVKKSSKGKGNERFHTTVSCKIIETISTTECSRLLSHL